MKIQQGEFSLVSRHETLQHMTREDTLQVLTRNNGKETLQQMTQRSSQTQVSLSLYGTTQGRTEENMPAYAGRLPGKNGIGNAFGPGFAQAQGQDKFDRSPEAVSAALAEKFGQPPKMTEAEAVSAEEETLDAQEIEDLRMLTFVRLMEQMFGLKITVLDDADREQTEADMEKLRELGEQLASAEPVASDQNGPPRNGHQVTYESHVLYKEEAFTHMAAEGKVVTEDGRELELSLDLGMSRSFETETLTRISQGNLKDPLVINFDRAAVGLSDSLTFQFDLDADGQDETLPELLAGSGYLALDLNDDGGINSGEELFGAASGDGFADLAQYDDDGNGFIDENDAVFSQLKIWVPKGDGEAELYALLDKDIGAIYLKSQTTPFALNKAGSNENQGYVRESGVALKESGGLASVQQIDLRV